jgi:hypothetical protein
MFRGYLVQGHQSLHEQQRPKAAYTKRYYSILFFM